MKTGDTFRLSSPYPATILRGHGYSVDFIAQSRTKPKQSRNGTDNPKTFILHIPYLNHGLDYALGKAAKDIGVRIVISQPQTMLGFLLMNRSSEGYCRNCRFGWRDLNDARFYRTMVVYNAAYNVCQQSYIGSTVRNLHQRWREHRTTSISAVYEHRIRIGHLLWTLTILKRGRDPVDLRIRESLAIEDNKKNTCLFKNYL